jgi:hypothetical protein
VHFSPRQNSKKYNLKKNYRPENFDLKEAQEELKKNDGITKKSESAKRNPLPLIFVLYA